MTRIAIRALTIAAALLIGGSAAAAQVRSMGLGQQSVKAPARLYWRSLPNSAVKPNSATTNPLYWPDDPKKYGGKLTGGNPTSGSDDPKYGGKLTGGNPTSGSDDPKYGGKLNMGGGHLTGAALRA